MKNVWTIVALMFFLFSQAQTLATEDQYDFFSRSKLNLRGLQEEISTYASIEGYNTKILSKKEIEWLMNESIDFGNNSNKLFMEINRILDGADQLGKVTNLGMTDETIRYFQMKVNMIDAQANNIKAIYEWQHTIKQRIAIDKLSNHQQELAIINNQVESLGNMSTYIFTGNLANDFGGILSKFKENYRSLQNAYQEAIIETKEHEVGQMPPSATNIKDLRENLSNQYDFILGAQRLFSMGYTDYPWS